MNFSFLAFWGHIVLKKFNTLKKNLLLSTKPLKPLLANVVPLGKCVILHLGENNVKWLCYLKVKANVN
jgi:hypothetical protein